MKIEFEDKVPQLSEAKEQFSRAYWSTLRARCRTVREMAELAGVTRQGAYRACEVLSIDIGEREPDGCP